MGKTLVGLLEVAAVIAVQFIPGIGQAVGVALGVSASAGTAIATAAVIGLEAIANATLLAPKAPKPDTTATAIKTALPPRVRGYGRSRLYGNYDLYVTSSTGVAVDVFSFLDTGGVAIDGVERLYLGDQQVGAAAGVLAGLSDGSFGGSAVEIDFRLGHATETAYSQLVSLLPGLWTTNHRGDGVVTGMVTWKPVKAKDYQKRYPNGQPALSLVARWQRVFDWRDVTQSVNSPATWKWSENAVLHLAHYILTVEKARRATNEMFPSGSALTTAWNRYFDPTLAYWTAAANDADVSQGLKAGGSEARYRGLVAYKLTDAHKDVKSRLLDCFDGWLAPREDGALIVYSGRYYPPTVSIGPDEIVSYSLQNGVEDENAVNDIAVTYLSAAHDYNTVNTDNWTDETDISARSAIRSETFSPDVPSHGQARRLTKRKMIRAMAPKRGTVTTNSGGRAARGQRFVHLLLQEGDRVFYTGPAEITSLTRNLATGGVTFNWIAMTSAVDAWNPTTEEGNPAPNGAGVTVDDLVAPTITTATPEFLYNVGAGTQGVCIDLIISGPDRDDLTWFVRTRTASAPTWGEREYTDIDPGATVEIVTEFVSADATIEVQTAYRVGDGRVSDWSTTASVITSTAGIAPGPATDLAVAPATGSANVTWRNPTTSNFDHVIVYRGTSTSFGSATAVSGSITGAAGATGSFTDTVAAGAYHWWVKAFNASGTGSTPAGPVDGTVS